jgi:dTMP kinase
LFITFEGIEGCGKSTQAKLLAGRLREFPIPLVFTFEPGGTRVGQDIRHILLDSQNRDLFPLAELFLYAADRAQHVEEVIKPALEQGKWVICDRFFDATTVYQGHARRQDMALIKVLNEKASPGITPDITFLIDCPVEVGLERAIKRNKLLVQDGQDRFEREKKDFHEAVRQGYLLMARENRDRFVLIDGTLEEDELTEVVFQHVRPHLAA